MMERVYVSDITLKRIGNNPDYSLSFREKIDLAEELDRLGVSIIETAGIENQKTDSLLIKSIASAVGQSVVAVPIDLEGQMLEATWEALKEAAYPRLQVPAPVSIVQMEYQTRMKPNDLVQTMSKTIRACKEICDEVEFIANDASRSEPDFLRQVLNTAIEAGATVLTICDTAGTMFPYEFQAFLKDIIQDVDGADKVRIGVSCANDLALADACALAAIQAGAREIKTTAIDLNAVSFANLAKLVSQKGYAFNVQTGVRMAQLGKGVDRIEWLCKTHRSKGSPFDYGVAQVEEDFMALHAHEDRATVIRVARQMGYDLSEEDEGRVYEAFLRIAGRKGSVGRKELDAIVASVAMQVPPTYQVKSYVINSGNVITATAHIVLTKEDEDLEGVSVGDGPVDAAFLAIENITGYHYELDDFQIQAVTQGREAMGESVVKLRSNGNVYSGYGISTDIIGASIRAYVSALNKIVYEEVNQ